MVQLDIILITPLQAAGNFNQDLGDALNIFPSTGFLIDADPATYDGPSSFVGGKGFGFDVGATHEISKNVLVSLSLTDLGYVQMDQKTQMR